MAPLLREADRDECLAGSGQGPQQSLLEGWEQSIACFTAWEGTAPVAMFGVVPWPDGAWAIWMLGSDRIAARAKALMRISKDWLERLRELNDLHAIMDARNTLHRRYCERLGARVTWTYPDFGVNKEPFLHLTWPKNV